MGSQPVTFFRVLVFLLGNGAGFTTEHGGDLDKAVARFGGKRAQWLDLSTGINPHPILCLRDKTVWTALPDKQLTEALEMAAALRYRTKACPLSC